MVPALPVVPRPASLLAAREARETAPDGEDQCKEPARSLRRPNARATSGGRGWWPTDPMTALGDEEAVLTLQLGADCGRRRRRRLLSPTTTTSSTEYGLRGTVRVRTSKSPNLVQRRRRRRNLSLHHFRRMRIERYGATGRSPHRQPELCCGAPQRVTVSALSAGLCFSRFRSCSWSLLV